MPCRAHIFGSEMNIKIGIALLALVLSGCGMGGIFGLGVHTQKTVVRPPSDVQVILTVSNGSQPVDHLAEHNFKIYENDLLLDRNEIGLRLLPKTSMTAGFTVLLVDVSGQPDESALRRIERGATHLVEKISVTQPVAVVVFDGSARPREVARFSQVERATVRPVPSLKPFLSGDQSRDVNGALLSVVRGVQLELTKTKKEAQFGTIITLLQGPDLAGRTDEGAVRKAIFESGYTFISVAPKGASIEGLSLIGHTRQYEFDTMDTLPMQLSDVGMHVRALFNSHYVLSYCSPGRAGERKLKVVVKSERDSGMNQRGSTKTKFSAQGFVGGCTEGGAPKLVKLTPTPAAPPAAAPPASTDSAPTASDAGEQEEVIVPPPSSGKYE